MEAVGDFSYAAYRTFQVPIRQIEALTALSFGDLAGFDPLDGLEATLIVRPVDCPNQLVL